jgi:ribonuclease HIII
MIKSGDIITGLMILKSLTKRRKRTILHEVKKVESKTLEERDLEELLRLVIEAIMALRTYTILPENEQVIKGRIDFFVTLKNRVINEIEQRKMKNAI